MMKPDFLIATAVILLLQSDIKVQAITCHCSYDGGPHSLEPCFMQSTCTVENSNFCIVLTENINGSVHTLYTCPTKGQLLPVQRPFICQPSALSFNLSIVCCFEDLCNKDLAAPTLPAYPVPDDKDDKSTTSNRHTSLLAYIIIGISVCLVLLTVLFLFYLKQKKQLQILKKADKDAMEKKLPIIIDEPTDLSWPDSGSGAGRPLLIDRTVARQIQHLELIGKGRYGEVFRGEWLGDYVAVKKFVTRDEQSWFREAEIYQTVMLRHDNILRFIASDNLDVGTWIELWLVAEYHENGSLFDYLAKNKVDIEAMLKLSVSIASGLVHLHMEICGTQGKPPIAHRDLKSKNILVKKNGECAIADLGLAVRHDLSTDTIDIPLNNKVGTKRYMAPEVLNDSLNVLHFDSFRKADIYALGLVLWEIARRCDVNGQDLKYELPYFDCVPDDPSIEEMKVVVCDEKRRPLKEGSWEKHETMLGMWNLMQECWHCQGSSRLSALRVKKSIAKVQVDEGYKA